jgi:hypothetical protein
MKIFGAALAGVASLFATSVLAQDADGFYAGYEILQFQWSDTGGDEQQEDLSTGGRVTFGYNTSDDNSVRLRVFGFAAVDEGGADIELGYADLEYVSQFTLSDKVSAEFSAGVRRLKLLAPTGEWDGSTGPVIAAKITSDLGKGFGFYGGARTSVVFGIEGDDDDFHQVAASELSTGFTWSRSVGAGALDINFGAEAQNYQSVRDGEEDYGLIGFAIGANYSF